MISKKLFVGLVFLVICTSFVFAGDYIALQGNVLEGSADLAAGDLVVTIYDAVSGGSMVYNSTTDFAGAIVSGKYDIMLGNGTNELNLNYGQKYYMEVWIDGGSGYEQLDFDGVSRQIFQSSVGNVSLGYINLDRDATWDGSVSFTDGNNVTLGTGGWFKGLFNWTVIGGWFGWDGASLSFNETKLNLTIGSYTSNLTEYAYNHTADVFTQYNSTWDQSYLNVWNYNQTSAVDLGYLQGILNTTGIYSTYNSTYDAKYGLDDDVKFNSVNVTGILRIGDSVITADSSGGLNITGEANFGGSWQDGGVTISDGNVWAQTLYVYNVTSLAVDSLRVNGTITPPEGFDDTFDLGSSSLQWQDLYLSGKVYIGGVDMNESWSSTYNATYDATSQDVTANRSAWFSTYNETYAGAVNNASYLSTYNATYDTWAYNQTKPAMDYTDAEIAKIDVGSGGDFYFANFSSSFDSNISSYSFSTYNATYDAKNSSRWNLVGSDISYSGGNVGVGTVSPDRKLHISTSDGTAHIRMENSATAICGSGVNCEYGTIEWGGQDGSAGSAGVRASINVTTDANSVAPHQGPATIIFSTAAATGSNTERMRIDSTGNVGIGTATPTHKLNVVGDINVTGDLIVEKNLFLGGTYTDESYTLKRGSFTLLGTDIKIIGGYHEHSNQVNKGDILIVGGPGMLQDGYGGDINISGGYAEYGGDIFIDGGSGTSADGNILLGNNNGNVGIGTNNPNSKLTVSGNGFGITATASGDTAYAIMGMETESEGKGYGILGHYLGISSYGGYFKSAGGENDFALYADGPIRAKEYRSSDNSPGLTTTVVVWMGQTGYGQTGYGTLTFKDGLLTGVTNP